jgi:UDP-N-acetylglucosamine:LPS N-acetylglucosamine transferase
MAVASAGGHWVQLKRVWSAFAGHELILVSTDAGYAEEAQPHRFLTVTEANLDARLRLCRLAVEMFWTVARWRPDVIVSTGAAPGYFALRFGKLFGARTVWLDSLANAETLSTAGAKVGQYADLWLTQWSHLAQPGGPHFGGAVL